MSTNKYQSLIQTNSSKPAQQIANRSDIKFKQEPEQQQKQYFYIYNLYDGNNNPLYLPFSNTTKAEELIQQIQSLKQCTNNIEIYCGDYLMKPNEFISIIKQNYPERNFFYKIKNEKRENDFRKELSNSTYNKNQIDDNKESQKQFTEKPNREIQILQQTINNLEQKVNKQQEQISLLIRNQDFFNQEKIQMQNQMNEFSKQLQLQNQIIQELQLASKSNKSQGSSYIYNTNFSNNSNKELELTCKHVVEKQQLEDIITNAIKYNVIAECNSCKESISDKTARQVGQLGDQYIQIKNEKNLRSLYEITKQKNPQNLVKCSNNTCNFFCFWNSNLYNQIPQQMYYCPSCLFNNVKPQIIMKFKETNTQNESQLFYSKANSKKY